MDHQLLGVCMRPGRFAAVLAALVTTYSFQASGADPVPIWRTFHSEMTPEAVAAEINKVGLDKRSDVKVGSCQKSQNTRELAVSIQSLPSAKMS